MEQKKVGKLPETGAGSDARLKDKRDIHKKHGTHCFHRCGFSTKIPIFCKMQ